MPGWRGPSLFSGSPLARRMIDHAYLQQGILAMARSHQAGSMAGHLGASLLAGYYLGEDHPNLPDPVWRGITRELNRIIDGEESIWISTKKTSVRILDLFAPPGDAESEQAPMGKTESLIQALGQHVGTLRQSGHNTIFAALALRAMTDHPELAKEKTMNGLVALMRHFEAAPPGRGYLGKAKGWVSGEQIRIDPTRQRPPFDSIEQATLTLLKLFAEEVTHRRQGLGGWFHLINHSSALMTLHEMGQASLVEDGLKALKHHLDLFLSLPDLTQELGSLKKANLAPREASYWSGDYEQSSQWSGWLTHRIKTMHGYYHIRQSLDSKALRDRCDEAFLYLMA